MGPALNEVEGEGTGGATTYSGCCLISNVEFGGKSAQLRELEKKHYFLKFSSFLKF